MPRNDLTASRIPLRLHALHHIVVTGQVPRTVVARSGDSRNPGFPFGEHYQGVEVAEAVFGGGG